MRLKAVPVGAGVAVPDRLKEVLRLGLEIGRASYGVFDIGMGDVVPASGFGPFAATPNRTRTAMITDRLPAHEALEIDSGNGLVRKTALVALGLNGIAKGYGVDRRPKRWRRMASTTHLSA